MERLHKAFTDAGHSLFEVGGCVRDRLMGVEPKDVDFATSAKPEETMEILRQVGLKVIPIGLEFGTVQTIIGDEKVEITTFRCQESYTKSSRKPEVVFGDTIEADLVRRDFTFNALARAADGSIVDLFNGVSDLANGIIRTPGDPSMAFIDDPLRMLRAARFVARGTGRIHVDTRDAMIKHRELVLDLSAERVFEEMTKLLMAKDPVSGLRALDDTGIFRVLFPEMVPVLDFTKDTGKWHHLSVWEHTLMVVESTPAIPEVRWASLFHDVAKPVCWSKTGTGIHFLRHDHVGSEIWDSVARKLKASNSFREHVRDLIFEHQCLRNEMGVKGIRRLIHRLGGRLDNLFHHTAADIKGHTPHIVIPKLAELDELRSRVDAVLAGPDPVTNRMPRGTGDVVCEALGIKPGPELGAVMQRLQKMMIDGDLSATSDFAAAAKKLGGKKETKVEKLERLIRDKHFVSMSQERRMTCQLEALKKQSK